MKKRLNSLIVRSTLNATLFALCFAQCTSDETNKGSVMDSAAGDGGAGPGPQSSLTLCGQPIGNSRCDPRTGAPCDLAAGETCDFSNQLGAFDCFPGPNPSGAGELCNADTQCGAGTTCDTSISLCQHYCCADSDCSEGACKYNIFTDEVAAMGVCDGEGKSHCGGGGAGGSGAGCPAEGIGGNAGE